MFPRDTVQVARLSFQLAVREAYLDQPTLTLPPATNPLELRVTRMPPGFDALSLRLEGEWSPVRLLLQEQMPLRFVGQAEVRFRTVEARDAAFASLPGLTDVWVGWKVGDDLPEVKEETLMQALATFGPCICAKIPRPLGSAQAPTFGFVSFEDREDAQRAVGRGHVPLTVPPGLQRGWK